MYTWQATPFKALDHGELSSGYGKQCGLDTYVQHEQITAPFSVILTHLVLENLGNILVNN